MRVASNTMRAVVAKSLGLSGLALSALFQARNGQEGLEVLRK